MNSLFNIPISVIKVRIPPRRAELVSRPRLIDQLYDQLDRPLLFVIAPAGYGKTSLLLDLAGQVDFPVCWLSLDTLDQDPQRFLRYIIAAITERFPEFGRDSLAVLGGMASMISDQEQILVTITNEINARVRGHFLLVLDDYHFVEASEVIGQVMNRFLQLAGENIHIIISSRNVPDMPASPLMIARNQVGGVSFTDLSFQPEEIQKLFQQNKGIELSQQDAETLLTETEGWIAAIHLSNGLPGSLPQVHPLVSTSVLFDFFSREIMERQPEPLRRFMLWTSIFDAFDAALCERVLGPLMAGESLDWPSLFRKVQSTNLFTVALDHEGRWIRYHHLFQHFLRSQLQYEKPALAWSIQQSLARAYEEQKSWEEALQIYDRLNDYQNQIRLLIETGINFIGAGRILTLQNWLMKIPPDLFYAQPMLISHLGVVHFTQGDQRQALSLLNQAEAGLRSAENQIHWVTTLVRRAEVHRQAGQHDAALLDIQKIFDTVGDDPAPLYKIIYAEAMRIRGLANFGLGRVREALPWLEESLRRYQLLGLHNQILILETELGVVHRRLGELQTTAQYYASALATLEQAGNTGWKARLLNNMGMLKYASGQLEEAYHLLKEAVQIAKQCGYIRIHTNILTSLGDLLTDLNDLDSAFACYDQALTQASNLGHSTYIFFASLGEARLKRLAGDPKLALEELRQAGLSQVNLRSYERGFFNLEQGLCLLDMNRVEQAVIVLRDAWALFKEGEDRMEEDIARLWYEVSNAALTGRETLHESLPPKREWRTPTPFMIQAGRAARWLKAHGHTRVLKNTSLRPFFEHAVRLLDTLPDLYGALRDPVSETPPLAPRFEIISFGSVQVRHDGRVVELSNWQTREARDLFFYFLQSPPRTKDQVATEFWPDLPPARLKMRFKINMHRIRHALGQDAILFNDEHYGFNRSIPYSWDRERFDELLSASQRRIAPAERIELLEEAVTIIRDRYLADLDAAWAEADRILYEGKRHEAMLNLAELYLRKGQGQECMNLARELLNLDPLMESAHRLVLQAFAAQHDPAGLAQQYHRYQKLLEDELGMLPSLEMRTLYETLLNKV